ncbi:MAG: MltA domain-containing protein [Acidobacteriota bacterium]
MSRSDAKPTRWRAGALLFALTTVLALALALKLWLRLDESGELIRDPALVDMPKPLPDERVLRAVSFEDLPGWTSDAVGDALPAWRRTCARYRFLAPDRDVRPGEIGGTVSDWSKACAATPKGNDDDKARRFFESEFAVLQVLNRKETRGLFTGYYEPLLYGSRARSSRYSTPLYRNPGDMISVDLGAFRDDLDSRSVAGRLRGKRLLPYWDRGEIRGGALGGRGLELLWVDDPVDAFFLQIQGSGQVEIAGGGRLRVGYAGQNGHAYYAIGRELIERGALTRENVSLQTIRAWLEANPDEAEAVMATNRSFVFFREIKGEGPIGSLGVALTPERSLAVDRRFLPLGAPVFLSAEHPTEDGEGTETLRRLLIAQDTGGAIRGPVRGDVFWGAGERAEEIAGRMKHEGELFLLLPKPLAERALATEEAAVATDA